jgi:hypothetical protein
MDIGDLLDQYPDLETRCREEISSKYVEMMGTDPLPEIIDYVVSIGVKNNSPRNIVHDNFTVLLKDRTEELVNWLFNRLAPLIRLEAQKREKPRLE